MDSGSDQQPEPSRPRKRKKGDEARVAPVDRDAYNIDEVAARLALSPRKIWELTKSGDLRTVRVGRRVLVPASAIAEFLDGDRRTYGGRN